MTVDSYATTPGVLWARVYPGEASSFEVFDGTALAQERTGTSVRLEYTPGQEFALGAVFEVAGLGGEPVSVTVDGADAGAAATWDASGGGRLRIEVPAGAHVVVVGE